MSDDGLRFHMSPDLARPGVSLDAMVRDSLEYARVMLALYAVVTGDHRAKVKDYSAYQQWVQERYLEELSLEMAAKSRDLPELTRRRDVLKGEIQELHKAARPLEGRVYSADFYRKRGEYFKWLWDHDKAAWMVLDPVVSVHPDCVVFEVFSIDESSYGRVTVPMDRLDTFGEVSFGTTNVDYSRALADEVRRVRSYRPAFLQINAGGVAVATGAGERLEKKIDLPPTWVRGFLQVQSAAAFGGIDLTLSPATVAEILSVLRRKREDRGPRSLRFRLVPGQCPEVVVDPWDTVVRETRHVYSGTVSGEIRIWGRRRLMVLESLMPTAGHVDIRLMGTGMPSYWTVHQKSHRFDLGLSGWTSNDWSRAARFDLLAATAPVTDGDVGQAAQQLERMLRVTPAELSAQTDLSRDTAAAALQQLCRDGRAMYDIAGGIYRWRQLLPFPAPSSDNTDPRLSLARRLIASGGVKFLKPGEEEDEEAFGAPKQGETTIRYRAQVRGGESKRERKFSVLLDLDSDGRAVFVQCNCSWHRREKLRKGPCAHILAATALASQQAVGTGAAAAAADTPAGLRQDGFKGMTFVFTGALTLFVRDQAEALVVQHGGKTSGSVSRSTTHVVAGEKAGSKLAKARELGIPILTEAEFQVMLEGKA